MDLHTLQHLLGHGSLDTTTRYLHAAEPAVLAQRAALDLLMPIGPLTALPPA